MTSLNLGHALVGRQATGKAAFGAGLDAMRNALLAANRKVASEVLDLYEAMPAPQPAKIEQEVRFIDEDGCQWT